MQKKRSYAVFGLGRYGKAVATELSENGMDVIAVDSDEHTVEDLTEVLPICKCADVTDPETIEQLGISNVDVVIIAMASHLEASVLSITLCKEKGVKTVIAKCSSEIHKKILKQVGADIVVFPEKESGINLAKNLLSSGFVDMISLSKDVSVIELDVKENWVGKSLKELNLRTKYSLNVVAIKVNDDVIVSINPDMPLNSDMLLIAIVDKAKFSKLKQN